jgi:hypothetical protein
LPCQHGIFLLFGHGPLVQISTFIGPETVAIGGLHQRHAELVEVVALAALLGIKDRGAGQVKIRFVE